MKRPAQTGGGTPAKPQFNTQTDYDGHFKKMKSKVIHDNQPNYAMYIEMPIYSNSVLKNPIINSLMYSDPEPRPTSILT